MFIKQFSQVKQHEPMEVPNGASVVTAVRLDKMSAVPVILSYRTGVTTDVCCSSYCTRVLKADSMVKATIG